MTMGKSVNVVVCKKKEKAKGEADSVGCICSYSTCTLILQPSLLGESATKMPKYNKYNTHKKNRACLMKCTGSGEVLCVKSEQSSL